MPPRWRVNMFYVSVWWWPHEVETCSWVNHYFVKFCFDGLSVYFLYHTQGGRRKLFWSFIFRELHSSLSQKLQKQDHRRISQGFKNVTNLTCGSYWYFCGSIMSIFPVSFTTPPVPVAARSKEACGRSFAGVAFSNPTGACLLVCYECCVLSGRGLCDKLITRPEKSYRL